MQSETQNGIKISSRKVGLFYEKIAQIYLLNQGYEIIAKNLFTKYGEIDILAKKKFRFYIFEVKGGKRKEEIFERFSKQKLERLKKLSEFIRVKYNLKLLFTDGIIIVTMEGTISVIHIKNILQQGC